MTANKNFKRCVRARALKTGESYTAALRHFQKTLRCRGRPVRLRARHGVCVPELFLDYERAEVHCVLLSTHGPGASFALQAQGHASTNSYWISYATRAADADAAPSGVVGPDGAWSARCPATDAAAVAIAGIDREHENLARPWRRKARADLYAAAAANEDPRASRDSF
jgi:hypothetical protein